MKNHEWQIQEAKNKFSELIQQAISEGPQAITRHGEKKAVMLSMRDYLKLQNKKGDLVDFFKNSPLKTLDCKRSRDFPREVKL